MAMATLLALAPLVGVAQPRAEAGEHPNIVLILTDDQGYGDVSIHGNRSIKTPNMDGIAREGARFERFFVEPVCAPTRAALLTGRYPTRTGVFGVTRNREVMRSEETTLAELLRDKAGYVTGCFGKWHNGANWPFHPNAQGFDEFVGFCGGHWNNYYDAELQHNGKPIKTRGFIADVLTDHAIEFMQSHANNGNPFLCYLPYNTPHTPASVPVADWARWHDREDVDDAYTRGMYALCENIDRNVGRVLDALDEMQIGDDTIVVFLTDNGPNGTRFNDGMLGRKSSVHEGGVRVPLFVRWPGKIASGTVIQSNVAHIDLLPTLCAMAGVENLESATLPLDGNDVSMLLLRTGKVDMPERNLFTWRTATRWSVRSSQYRATSGTLHDMWNDPGQQKDLAKEHPEIHRRMVSAFERWAADAVPTDPTPQAVHLGHDRWPRVTISAHELEVRPGMGQGINYSGPQGFANQWITDWTDPAAFADCPLSVVDGGTYRVTIRYACDPGAVGSVFALEIGASSLQFKIDRPWISEPRPAPEVERKRHNSYLSRDWAMLEAGEMTLRPGQFMMQLRAVTKSGAAMPEVKAIVFEKAH